MPSLEWEENVFLGLKALYKSIVISPKEREIRTRQADLKDLKGMLMLVGQMLSGRQISIFETEDDLLYLDDRICLPKRMHLGEDIRANQEIYLLRTVVSALAIRDDLNSDNSTIEYLISLCEQELPAFSERLLNLMSSIQRDVLLFPRLPTQFECKTATNESIATIVPGEQSEGENVTELEGQGRVNVVEVREGETGEQDIPFHTFEKAETLDEYNGLSRQNDADDELMEHAEALSKLKMDSIIRSPDRSPSVYKADIMLDGVGFELRDSKLVGIPYPEWDYKRKSYRSNWCYVQESLLERTNVAWAIETQKKHASLILTLKKKFATIATEWLQSKKQLSGDEIDLDAVIELLVRLKTKEPPPDYLYLAANRTLPNVATMILIDTSYSTDSWVENRCVMDVMKETVFCIAEVLEDARQQLGIYGFSSNTRQSCNVASVKNFNENWSVARNRLGGLSSVGYTRIGPALRHAYTLLSGIKAEKKMLILLTDGKPCDYDRYEGRYGIEDVRKAIQEGKSVGVVTHAFAIDKQARDYFPIMFTRSNFDIVAHPSKLLDLLFNLYLNVCIQ